MLTLIARRSRHYAGTRFTLCRLLVMYTPYYQFFGVVRIDMLHFSFSDIVIQVSKEGCE